eukprot:CAMPEP_0197441368 /NCGR_PEP_ID=MMETSP1175-20131217/7647_1 /TAXON_ID=1003142 /ORGANISM="Triceratium dubium, Strain CCMP147" /LENGTH=798 /DNA_ID=CAMNT_0042971623 /DNA_START=308 /DNA_END=2701 /DNA_ORIENTATION=-
MPLKAVAAALKGGVGGGRRNDGAASSAPANGSGLLSKKPKHGATSGGGSKRPRLVQRTSSVDTRKDVSHLTWASLLGLLKPREYFVTVDHFSIWRRHLSWAKEDGSQLRTLMTQKFSTNMVFMSLLLGAEMNVLFNSSHITTQMRQDMKESNHNSFEFWIGLGIITSVVLTLFTLLSTFTAWGMVSAVSDQNAHCVMRSSIGQYVCFLPSRLIVTAIYSFLVWMVMFLFILLPKFWSLLFLAVVVILFFHIVTVFSTFGRLIMHSGAMGTSRIFDPSFEMELLPRGLHTSLLFKATDELRKGTSVTRQYREPSRPIGQVDEYSTDDEADDLDSTGRSNYTGRSSMSSTVVNHNLDAGGGGGGVRFADQLERSVRSESGRDDQDHTESNIDSLHESALIRWISTDSVSTGVDSAAGSTGWGASGGGAGGGLSDMFPPPSGVIGGGKSRSAPSSSSADADGGSATGGMEIPPPNTRQLRGGSLSSSVGSLGRPPKASATRPPLGEGGGPRRSSGTTKRASFQDEENGGGGGKRRAHSRSPSPRPSLMAEKLNSGNHTAKSLRRLASEMTETSSDDEDSFDGSGAVRTADGGKQAAENAGNVGTVESKFGDGIIRGGGASVGASFDSDGSSSLRGSPPKSMSGAPPSLSQGPMSRPRPRPGPSLLRQSSYARRTDPPSRDAEAASGGLAGPPSSSLAKGGPPPRQRLQRQGRSQSPYQSDSSADRGSGDHPLLKPSPKKKKGASSRSPTRVRTNTADIVDIVKKSLGGDWDAMGGAEDHKLVREEDGDEEEEMDGGVHERE